MSITVGEFTFEAGTVTGPAAYMQERGNAKLEEIQAGKSVVFNLGAAHAKGAEGLVNLALVALQTDYAAWKGLESLRPVMSIFEAVQKLTDAIGSSPECLQAQQTHQAVTIPTLRSELIDTLCDQLGEEERDVLREALDTIDGDSLREDDGL